ncbi:MAG: pilus assembly protein PilP [Burkholderiales bacterium]
MKNAPWIVMIGFLVAGCGGEQYGDLKEELNALTTKLQGKVEPLPVVKPYEPVPYEVSDLADPFGTAKFETVARSAGTGTSKLKPDDSRPKEPLEAFALESLKMVGTLQQGKQTFALIRADASLYRIKTGNYLGQNFGLVTEVSETEIKLRELVQDPGGDWTERIGAIQLQEIGK